MKPKFLRMYMDFALRAAQESHALRLKVGAVFVSPDGVMSMGINGMPAGGTNDCEYRDYFVPEMYVGLNGIMLISSEDIAAEWPLVEHVGEETTETRRYKLITKPEVSHAEENLFSKLMNAGVSTKGGTVFITHEPCLNCAKIIVGAGIKKVVYQYSYTGSSIMGKEWLRKNGIVVEQITV